MNINLLAKNIELTSAIRDYVEKKITNLGKILNKLEEEGADIFVHFEVGRSTNSTKKGDFFHADCSITIKGENFYASADEVDLYQAIDTVKENLFNKINKKNEKQKTLFRRGASKIKKILKGLYRRKN